MTSNEAKTLKYGDKVDYLGAPAIVQYKATNGVVISYDGKGPKSGQYLTARVSAAYLQRATVAA
jgi:hypothetical protein